MNAAAALERIERIATEARRAAAARAKEAEKLAARALWRFQEGQALEAYDVTGYERAVERDEKAKAAVVAIAEERAA